VKFPAWQGCLKAPTILLLCKQITRECLPILESRFLVIDRMPPWPKDALQPVPLAEFIGKGTLQSVKRLELRLTLGQGKQGSGWYWVKIMDEVLDILLEKNSYKELRIILCVASLRDWDKWREETCYLRRIRCKVSTVELPHIRPLALLLLSGFAIWWNNTYKLMDVSQTTS
jgi:hypothetical protein